LEKAGFLFASKEWASLHILADQYFLTAGLAEYKYEGHKEIVPINITLTRILFSDKNLDSIMMKIEPMITLYKVLESKIHLTTRELSVLQLLTSGNSQKKIALLLGLSPHTVAGYLKVIYVKLGVKSSTQASLIGVTRFGMRAVARWIHPQG